MQCPHITVVAGLAMLLELDNVNNNAVEWAVSLIGSRMSTNVLFYLALDARDARICLLCSFSVSAYCKACSGVLKMLNSLIA
jgi:hypothetical protein